MSIGSKANFFLGDSDYSSILCNYGDFLYDGLDSFEGI